MNGSLLLTGGRLVTTDEDVADAWLERGSLRPGARADVTLLSADLRPVGVLFRGRWARTLPVGGAHAGR